MAERSIEMISFNRIKLSDKLFEAWWPVRSLGERRSLDKNLLLILRRNRVPGDQSQYRVVLREIAIDRIEDCALIVSLGLVANDPRETQLLQYRGDILVLELDRAMRTVDSLH